MDHIVEPGSEGLQLALDELGEAHVRLVGGEVSLAGTSSPPRLEVDDVTGEPVHVRLHDGVLTVEQPPARSRRYRHQRATVTLTMPPAAAASVRTESAALLAAGLAGDMSFASASGELTGTCLSGDVRARTVSGEVALDGVAGRLRAESVSGQVTVVGGLLQELEVRSVTGDVAVDLDPRPGAHCHCHTVSGRLTVRLPSDASVDFEAESVAGRIALPEWAEGSEERTGPPWAHMWTGAAQAWAGRAGEWVGRAGEWADTLAGAGARLLADAPASWGHEWLQAGRIGRAIRGRLGVGEATLRLASIIGDISMVCTAPAEAVA